MSASLAMSSVVSSNPATNAGLDCLLFPRCALCPSPCPVDLEHARFPAERFEMVSSGSRDFPSKMRPTTTRFFALNDVSGHFEAKVACAHLSALLARLYSGIETPYGISPTRSTRAIVR